MSVRIYSVSSYVMDVDETWFGQSVPKFVELMPFWSVSVHCNKFFRFSSHQSYQISHNSSS